MDIGASSYRRFLDGDNDGMVHLIRDYKDGLMLYLNSFVQNIHLAETLMEDTFVKLVAKRPRFSGKSSFKTWLYAIGRNLAIDHLRHAAKEAPLPAEDLSELLADEADVERAYLQSERSIRLHQALKKLKPEYRTVLYLAFFEEMKNRQIATAMGKSAKQVENLLYRARLSLRSELEKEGFVYEELS